jgi:hypothetical protein
MFTNSHHNLAKAILWELQNQLINLASILFYNGFKQSTILIKLEDLSI